MGDRYGFTSEDALTKFAKYVLLPVFVTVLSGTILLFIEYKTNYFEDHYPQLVPQLLKGDSVSSTAAPMIVESAQAITIETASMGTLFDGGLNIAVQHASKTWNTATFTVSSPAYPEKECTQVKVGYKYVYKSSRDYEILVTAIQDAPAAVTFAVVAGPGEDPTVLTVIPTPSPTVLESPTPIVFEAMETRKLNPATTVGFFGDDLFITVDSVNKPGNAIYARISSPGHPEKTMSMAKVGSKIEYEGNNHYEIQITAAEGGGLSDYNSADDSATFVVRKYKR